MSGKIAGENMVSSSVGREAKPSATHSLLSMYWCDLSPVGVSIEAVGVTDPTLSTVGVWTLPGKGDVLVRGASSSYDLEAGIIWYLRNGVAVGAVLWNVGGKKNLDLAKDVIRSRRTMTDVDFVSAVPFIEDKEKVLIKVPKYAR